MRTTPAGDRVDLGGQLWDGGSMANKDKPKPVKKEKPTLPMSPPAEHRFRGAPWFFRGIRRARGG